MAELFGLGDCGIKNTADLVQQTAAFLWLHKGDEFKELFKKFTGYRVANEIFGRITKRDEIDEMRAQCIMDIVTYIKLNPKASEAQLEAEIMKRVADFKQKIEAM